MTKVLGIRWDRDCGGMACGPIEGSVYVELEFEYEGKKLFLLESQFCEFQKFQVFEEPMMDRTIDLMENPGVESSKELVKIEKMEIDGFERIVTEWWLDENGKESRFEHALRLASIALDEYYNHDEFTDDIAEGFISKYAGKDLEKMDLQRHIESIES